MRDPQRIGPMLDLLERIWRRNPDLRLGQLINNTNLFNDVYYMSDEKLVARLIELYGDGQ